MTITVNSVTLTDHFKEENRKKLSLIFLHSIGLLRWIEKNFVSSFLYEQKTKNLLISALLYLLNLVALHQSIVAQHRPNNDDDNDNDNADDGDGYDNGDGDGDDGDDDDDNNSDAHQSAVAEPRLNNK